MTRVRGALGAAYVAVAIGGFAGTAAFAETMTTVVAKKFSFAPSTVTAEAGETVTIEFANKGSLSHNLTFKKLDAKTETIQSGNTQTIEVQVDAPGTYQFICTVPGHAQAGMKGKLVVE
jgi:nitrite reductase (NO-forming)